MKRRTNRPLMLIWGIVLIVVVVLYVAFATAFQNNAREANVNAETFAYEVRQTVVSTLTP